MNAPILRLAALLLALASLLPSGCSGSPGSSDATAGGGGSSEVLTSDISGAGSEGTAKPYVTVRQDAKPYEAWHLEFRTAADCAAWNPIAGKVFNRYEKWADVFVPANSLRVLNLAGGLVWMDRGQGGIIPPLPPEEPVASRGTTEPIVRGGVSGLKGKGVIIAVVDSGLDFRHPDFITTDSQGQPVSRLKYLWDTTSDAFDRKALGGAAPIQYPNGASLGTLYTRDQLTAELRATTRSIPSTDLHGHGTACAGIAAGNGRAYNDLRYTGVAPEADLIAVRIGGTPTPSVENAYLLPAICAWIDSVAGKQPCVISCSFGGQEGGRDGSAIVERQLDARFRSDVRGRAICIAAGNDRARALHAEAVTGAEDKAGLIEFEVPAGSVAEVFAYVSSDDVLDFSLAWTGKDQPPAANVRKIFHKISKNVIFSVVTGPGSYGMKVVSAAGQSVAADAYIRQLAINGPLLKFSGATVSMAKQVGTPGTALQALSIGSYDFSDQVEVKGRLNTYRKMVGGKPIPFTIGGLSDYSNPGPRRTGDAVKPDLVAPGELHVAALAGGDVSMSKGLVETSGKYCKMDGTSSATPYCAGVVALMFEKKPDLTLGEVRRIFQTTVTQDTFTGKTPNGSWGYGKLDLKAVRAAIAAVK